jgi:tetratricopeptide (TPR) repeat protein
VEECADFNEKAFIMKSWTGTVEELITVFSAKPIREESERSAAWAAYRLSVLLELQPTGAQASRPASQRAELARYVEVFAPHETAIEFRPNDPAAHNAYAWLLATAPEPKNRDPSRAVKLATRALELAPTVGAYWNTLGAAQYRAGNWNGAIQALNKSLELRGGGDVNDWFFLAMAHQRLGRNDQARKWYDEAVDWIEKYEPHNTELGRLRAEAAGLLGIR